jgi:DNA-directed RNA polymerase subunit M/transcription elongation factor TFIIS
MDRKVEIKNLCHILRENSTFFTDDEILSAATEMEESIYTSTDNKLRSLHIMNDRSFANIYNAKMFEIKIHLDITSTVNTVPSKFLDRVYATMLHSRLSSIIYEKDKKTTLYLYGILSQMMYMNGYSLNLSDVGNLSPEALHPTANKSIIDTIESKKQQKVEEKGTSMHTCEVCGESNTREKKIDTCSADEGSTLFIECINCGNRWRDYS